MAPRRARWLGDTALYSIEAMVSGCLTDERIAQYVDGLLTSDALAAVETHVARCDGCRRLLSAVAVAASEPDTVKTGEVTWPQASQSARQGVLSGALLKSTYRLGDLLGRGGMGVVYAASHVALPRRFAVKVLTLSDEVEDRDSAVARFRREAELTSSLEHPNIVQVIDFGETPDGLPFLVMEHLAGESLASAIRGGRVRSVGDVARVIADVARALEAVHERGVTHRDLKPTNIFLAEADADAAPTVKVLDFGISKVAGASGALTRTGSLVGTPGYMAPEQASGGVRVDHRADIFALGAIAYRMIAGRAAFRGESVPAVLYNVVHADAPPMARHDGGPWSHLEAVVRRALAKAPEQRFETIAAFAARFAEAAAPLSDVSLSEGRAVLDQPTAEAPTPTRAAPTVGAAAPGLEDDDEAPRPVASAERGGRRGRATLVGATLLLAAAAGVFAAKAFLDRGGASGGDDASPSGLVTARRGSGGSQASGSSGSSGSSGGSAAGASADAGHGVATQAARRDARAPSRAEPDSGARGVAPSKRRARRASKRRRRGRRGRASRARKPATLIVQTLGADGEHLWANVRLDGRRVGQTALKLERLAPGKHRLSLSRPGYRTERRTIWLAAAQRRVLRVRLRRAR